MIDIRVVMKKSLQYLVDKVDIGFVHPMVVVVLRHMVDIVLNQLY